MKSSDPWVIKETDLKKTLNVLIYSQNQAIKEIDQYKLHNIS